MLIGLHVVSKPNRGPKPKQNFLARNRRAASAAKNVHEKRKAVVPKLPRSRGGNTARPEPLTGDDYSRNRVLMKYMLGRGLWDN